MGRSSSEAFPGDHPVVQQPCGHGWVRVCRSIAANPRPGDPEPDQPGPGSLGERLAGRRVLIGDETTRTGESLAWAASVARQAGAAAVRTAVLFRPSHSPRTDYWGAITDAHLLQPWGRDCV